MLKSYLFAAKNNWPILLGLNAFIFGAAFINLFLAPKVWTADAELILPNPSSSLNTDLGELGVLNDGDVTFSQQLNPLKIVASILGSDTVMEEVLATDPERDLFGRLQGYKKLFEISPQAETTVINVAVDASAPDLAEQRLESLIQNFQARLSELRKDEAERRSEFALKELETVTKELETSRTALADYKTSANIVDGNLQATGFVNTLGDLTTVQAQAVAQAQVNRALSNSLSDQLGLLPGQALNLLRLNENQNYLFLQRELSEAETALLEKQALFTNEHPEVQYLIKQRNQLLDEVNQYINQAVGLEDLSSVDISLGENASELIQQMVVAETQANAAVQQAEQLQVSIDQINEDLLSLPSKQANLAALQQQYDVAEATYRGLTAQLQEARLSAFGAYPVIQILDRPTVDTKPSSPNKKLVFAGTLFAALAGTAALLLFLDYRDPLLSDREILTTELKILGQIPKFKSLTTQENLSIGSHIAFQRLASAVSTMKLKNHRLLITSAQAVEGKTSVSMGLASALTALGFSVLLVDGDLQNHTLSKTLLNTRTTWSHSQKRISLQETNSDVTTIEPNLDLVSFNHQVESFGTITHGEFEKILSQIQSKRAYDYVIIDGASLNMTATTTLLAKIAVNILMVTRPGLSKSFPFRESVEQLAWYETHIVGLVVNAGEAPVERQLERPSTKYLSNGVSV
ncbi:MAG: AAA family ATPase [Leptolyngbya sp. SIO3F4]|nr:AAA family ATPase [Leptolyngbya sp. SIO3F4]